jgi:hypothetical protein
MKATNLHTIRRNFSQQPVEIEQLDEWYVDVRAARGQNPRGRLKRLLEENQDNHQRILFVGYRGCGKSTELNHLQADLDATFLTLNFSVIKELDAVSMSYIELFIVAMEKLFELVKDKQFTIRPEYLKSITNWAQSSEIQEIRDKYFGAELGVDASGEVKGGIEQGVMETPALLKLFAGLKLSAKTSKSFKETLKRNVEPKLSELVFHCNQLIQEVLINAHTKGYDNLLMVIEDLDKIPLDKADELFFTYANQLTQLETNIIYTFPVALYYHTRFNTIRHHFNEVLELPMIKVVEMDGSRYENGYRLLRRIVEKRMDIGLFKAPELLDQMIGYSGGCVRDLFLMIKEAADTALDSDREQIGEEELLRALQLLKKEYDNNVADYRKPNGVLITAGEYYEVLVNLARSEDKKLENTEAAMDLRQNLCILGYNGEGWCDVHPIMKEVLKDRGLLP